MDENRRRFLKLAAATGGGLLIGGPANAAPAEAEEEVTPAEDLMREHGVLKRVLLVYREAVRRIDAGEGVPPEALLDATGIVRHFIEDYHEKLEEEHLFPRFRKAGKLVDLVDVLLRQHQAGRKLTDRVTRLTSAKALKSPDDRKKLAGDLRLFVRMYEPHEAREDTILFPALRQVVSRNEYDAMGEDFEKREHELFGEEGFETMVDRVAGIEKTLGIYDLSQFTPEV